ncbi:BQ5605_C036g11474 [Microbotryum silenes-dioicae]|uniref:BQ5605_C036g11474 protein n=1 Tax=Microbotryum silenes-dioicae TaxID=796604 RepID=A0A2X0MIN4_9BASI|nr:BQ5605_C036g11474 [Microbotryum silenes-dioicae]
MYGMQGEHASPSGSKADEEEQRPSPATLEDVPSRPLNMRPHPRPAPSTSRKTTAAMTSIQSSTSAPTRSLVHLWHRLSGSPSTSTGPRDVENERDPNQDENHAEGANDEDATSDGDHEPDVPGRMHRRSTSVPYASSSAAPHPPASPPASSSAAGFLSSHFSIDPEPVLSRLRRVQHQRTPTQLNRSPASPTSPSAAAAAGSLSPSRLSESWDRFRPRWPHLGAGSPGFHANSNSSGKAAPTQGSANSDDSDHDASALNEVLDGDEGVVVDDEACFVEGSQGKVDFLCSLPIEISLFILLHLDHVTLLEASAVSRTWRLLALDNVIWRDLFHQHAGWRIREPFAPSVASTIYHDAPSKPPSIRRAVTSAMRRDGSRRSNAGGEASGSGPETPTRLVRRISDMVDTLGSLSLTPLATRATPTRETAEDPMSASMGSDSSWAHASQILPGAIPRRTAPSVISTAPPSTSTVATNAFAAPPRTHSSARVPLSRAGSSSALANLASSIAHLPPSLGPSRRNSSATLPPLGSIPSPLLGSIPSAPLTLNWPRLFRDRYLVEERWKRAAPRSNWYKGHTDSVYCLQFDPKKIISGSRDRSVRVWDIATGRTTKVLTGHEGSVLCLRYNDKVLITGSSDSTILVWDLVGDPITGRGQWEATMQLIGHNMAVLDLTFDDQWIVSCSKDTTIRVWHRSTGELYRVLAGHRGPVNAVQLHNNRVVSASGDATMKMWNVLTGEVERVFTGHERGLACATLSASGTLVASGSNDKMIRVWDVTTGTCLAVLRGHTDLVRSLAFDEARGLILSGSYDRTTRVWDWKSQSELAKYKQHTSLVFHVEFDASRIISSSHDRKILSLDFGEGLDTSLFV